MKTKILLNLFTTLYLNATTIIGIAYSDTKKEDLKLNKLKTVSVDVVLNKKGRIKN